MEVLNKRVGKSEQKILVYLAENPFMQNKDISETLKEEKGNISHRIRRLKEKGFIKNHCRVNGDKYVLTKMGLNTAIILGANLNRALKKYVNVYLELCSLKKANEILLEEVEAWKTEGPEIMVKMLTLNETLENYSPRVRLLAQMGVYHDWLKENVSKGKMKRIAKRMEEELPNTKEAVQIIF